MIEDKLFQMKLKLKWFNINDKAKLKYEPEEERLSIKPDIFVANL